MPTNRPWEQVTEDSYFRAVLWHMHHSGLGPKDQVRARFGLTGNGIRPNFQLEGVDARVIRFSGMSLKQYHEDPFVPFDPDQMSEESFSLTDIQSMIARCRAGQ